MSHSGFIDIDSVVEEGHCQSQVRPAPSTTTAYAEFEFEDSAHHEPLLAHDSDQESLLDDCDLELKQLYKLPSEGGTIFSSFVSLFFLIIIKI